MNICIIVGAIANFGGTERMACWLANQLVQRGYHVTLLSYWNHGTPFYHVDKRVCVSYLLSPVKEGKLYRTRVYPYFKMRRWFKRHRFDVVIEAGDLLPKLLSNLLRRLNITEISWEHISYYYHPNYKKKLLANQGYVVTLTQKDRLNYINAGGFHPEHVFSIVNPSMFISDYPYNPNTKKVLYVGRFAPEKNLIDLLKAWSMIQTDWTLQMVGDGEDKDKILSYIKDNQISNVSIISPQKNVQSFYKNASLFVLSSKYEGFSLVLVEAASFGLPCISYDCPVGPAEIIVDGQTGFLVEQDNVKQLAEKISYLMKHPELAKIFSANAKQRILNHFSESYIIEKWIQLLSAVQQIKVR